MTALIWRHKQDKSLCKDIRQVGCSIHLENVKNSRKDIFTKSMICYSNVLIIRSHLWQSNVVSSRLWPGVDLEGKPSDAIVTFPCSKWVRNKAKLVESYNLPVFFSAWGALIRYLSQSSHLDEWGVQGCLFGGWCAWDMPDISSMLRFLAVMVMGRRNWAFGMISCMKSWKYRLYMLVDGLWTSR